MKMFVRISRGPRGSSLLFIFLSWLSLCLSIYARPTGQSPIYQLAKDLFDSVVRVEAIYPNGKPETGFGFIVGERDNQLFIVTANHIVRNEKSNSPATRVRVMFHTEKGIWNEEVKLLETRYPMPNDLAVLRVNAPKKFTLRHISRLAIESGDLAGTSVLYIGSQGEWNILSGKFNRGPDKDSLFRVETGAIEPGGSGGPVLTNTGVIGMILGKGAAGIAEALSIDFIREAFKNWGHPWSDIQLLSRNKPVKASQVKSESEAARNVNDGSNDTPWNAGGPPPNWIEIDLQEDCTIHYLKLLTAQSREGETNHVIDGFRADGRKIEMATLNGYTWNNKELTVEIPEDRGHDIRKVRITTMSSPSWVAWREIEIYGRKR